MVNSTIEVTPRRKQKMVHIQTNFTAESMNTGKKPEVVKPVVKAEPKKKAKPEPVVEPVVVEETPVAAEPEVVEEAPVAE